MELNQTQSDRALGRDFDLKRLSTTAQDPVEWTLPTHNRIPFANGIRNAVPAFGFPIRPAETRW